MWSISFLGWSGTLVFFSEEPFHSADSRMIKAKSFRHLLSMFSFKNSWSPTAFSQKENMASRKLFCYCRKRSVLPILFGLGKVSFINSRSGGAYVEEAVEEHHHGSGPDTWGINSAARIVNQGKGRMRPEFGSHPRPRPRWQPNLVRHNWEREHPPRARTQAPTSPPPAQVNKRRSRLQRWRYHRLQVESRDLKCKYSTPWIKKFGW